MKNYLEELTDKVYELYKVYESYSWNKDNRRIVIVLEEKNIISFYLYENQELLDEVHISFDNKEQNLYHALSLRLFVKALGNVLVHRLGHDIYFNAKHKRYLLFIVKNQILHASIEEILVNQENEIINLNNVIVKEKSALVKNKIFSKKFLKTINNRIKITNDILRKW